MPALADVKAGDLKRRYPSFANVDDGFANAILDEARGSVNLTWIEGDRVPALLALAAHLLMVEFYNSGLTDVDGEQVAVTGPMESIEVGDVKVKYAHKYVSEEGKGGGDAAGYAGTVYGQRYLALYRRSFPSVMVV